MNTSNNAPHPGGLIYKKMAEVKRVLKAVAKERSGDGISYKYRGIEDVVNALHGPMADAGIIPAPVTVEITQVEKRGANNKLIIHTNVMVEHYFFAEDGSYMMAKTPGEGMDYGGDKSTSKAMTNSEKIALVQVFKIPTQDMVEVEEARIEAVHHTAEPQNEDKGFLSRAKNGRAAMNGSSPPPPKAGAMERLVAKCVERKICVGSDGMVSPQHLLNILKPAGIVVVNDKNLGDAWRVIQNHIAEKSVPADEAALDSQRGEQLLIEAEQSTYGQGN